VFDAQDEAREIFAFIAVEPGDYSLHIGEHWRLTELLAEQHREADWRSRATSAVCLGMLAGLLAAGYAIQAARLR